MNRKGFCIPGVRLTDVAVAVDAFTELAKADTLYVIHAGTMDLQTEQSEDPLAWDRRISRQYKEVTSHHSVRLSSKNQCAYQFLQQSVQSQIKIEETL